MNAADHLVKAEQLLDVATEQGEEGYIREEHNLLVRALVHTVAAVAIELGVPPVPAAPAGGSGG